MNDASGKGNLDGLANLAIDPEMLARELAAELDADPLEEIDLEGFDADARQIAKECEAGLVWLKQGHEERLQGLRVFCEHRDPRAIPLLLPLLREPCPVERMSAVYALGRNPCPPALDLLLNLLKTDSNAFVRKATAWSLGNYSDSSVIQPLINALKNDVAAVRLWASGSLADVGSTSEDMADRAAKQLLISLSIDSETVVRSNCIWALSRLYPKLDKSRSDELVTAFINALLTDDEDSVREESRIALEQLDEPEVFARLKDLINEGVLV